MEKKNQRRLLRSLLVPILSVIGILAVVIVAVQGVIFYQNNHKQIVKDSLSENKMVAENVSLFVSEAYALSEDLAQNPSILTMETEVQTPILENCVSNNPYLELLYVQGTDGMQTGRSSGELANRSTRWWFQQVVADQKPFVSQSYYSVNTGMPCASVFFPMYKDKDFTGVFATDIKLDSLVSLVSEMSDTKKDKIVFIIDGEGTVVAHPNAQYIEELYNYKNNTRTVSLKDNSGNVKTDDDGNILTEEKQLKVSDSFSKMITSVMSGKNGSTKVKMGNKTYFASYSPIVMDGESVSWSAITLQNNSILLAPLVKSIIISVLVALVALIFASLGIRALTKKITDPLEELTDAIELAAEGDFSIQAKGSITLEITTLAESFNNMTGKISRILRETVALIDDVKGSSERLATISEQSEIAASDMEVISDGTVSQLEDTEKALALTDHLKQINEEMTNINKTLNESTLATKNISREGIQSVLGLKEKSEESLKAVEKSFEKVIHLSESSEQIGSIVQEINEISSQTSLLALNASIEAARAGEQGKGFAVVASEVSSLANSSEDATRNIEEIITKLQEQIQQIVTEIDGIKETFEVQIAAVGEVESSFDHFRKASEETMSVVEQVESLIDSYDSLNHQVVDSIDSIYEVSKQTEENAERVLTHIQDQKEDIYDIAGKVANMNTASEMLKLEMSKLTIE